MNQQVKKIIKSSLCPKEKWVRDKQSIQCFNCGKQFNPFFRRKHHCRYCGQIFCVECSDNFFSGKDLGEPQKQIRMCSTCYNICWKYIMKHDQTYLNHRKSSDGIQIPDQFQRSQSETSMLSNDDKLREINSIVHQYQQDEINFIRKLEQRAGKKIMTLIQVILKENQIPLKFLPQIFDITVLINNLLPANAMITQQMNINASVKIKCFFQHNTTLCFKLKHGFLIKNNHSNKKVKSQFFNVNCILVYGSLQSKDILGMQATFENIVNFRLRQLTKLVSYCTRLKIQLIFIEGNVQRQVQQALAQNGISVISKVETEELQSLKRVLEIQSIVQNISKLSKYLKQQIIGFTAEISTVTEKQICFKNQQQSIVSRKYLLVGPKRTQNGLTLGIYGQNNDILRSVQKQLPFILKLMRHLKLVVHRIQLDQSILDSMDQVRRNDCYINNPEMFFSYINQHQADINNYLKVNYLSLIKIKYYQTFPFDIGRQCYDQYIKHRKYSFFHKWSQMTSICGNIEKQHILYYHSQDMPIGDYILKKMSESRKICPQCHKSNYSHIQVFYSSEQYIKCWVQTRLLDQQIQPIERRMENNQFSLNLIFQRSSKKQPLKSSKICTFIQCLDCQEILSKKMAMTKQHLQFSFYIWIFCIFRGATESLINYQKRQAKNHKQICFHHSKVRVFEYSDKMVKFFVGKHTPSRTFELNPNMQQIKYIKSLNNYLNKLSMIYGEKSQILLTFVLDKLKKIANFFDKNLFDDCIKNPKNSSLKIKKSLLISPNVSKTELVQLMLPDLISEINALSNACENMFNDGKMKTIIQIKRSFLSIICICKLFYKLYLESERAIKEKDFSKKYKLEDIQNFQNLQQQLFIDHVQLNASSQLSDKKSSFLRHDTEEIEKQPIQNMQKDPQNAVSIPSNTSEFINNFQSEKQDQSQGRDKKQRKQSYASSMVNQQNTTKNFQKDIKSLFRQKFYFPISKIGNKVDIQSYQLPGSSSSPLNILISALLSRQYKRILSQGSLFKWIAIFMEEAQYSFCLQKQYFKRIVTVLQTQMSFLQSKKQRLRKQSHQIHKIQVDILYPIQFSKLRQKNNITHQKLIECLQRISQLNNAKDGRYTLQHIAFDFDNQINIQRISGKQYFLLKRMLPQYFLHIDKGTMLSLIFGVYSIKKSENSIDYFIIWEKLSYGMGQTHTYDLSYANKHRFSKNPYKPMDLNFLIDRNFQPIMTIKSVIKNLKTTIDFLWKLNIVDYSVFLIIGVPKGSNKQARRQMNKDGLSYLNGGQIKIGIVNYLQQYVKSQGLQVLWKFGQTQPQEYRNRILSSITKYFVQIPL